jgi:hypothetical protein
MFLIMNLSTILPQPEAHRFSIRRIINDFIV